MRDPLLDGSRGLLPPAEVLQEEPETRGPIRAAVRWLFTPTDDPVNDTCVRIGAVMVAGMWVIVGIVLVS